MRATLCISFVGLSLGSWSAGADEPPPAPGAAVHWYDEVAIHGLVSFSANVNLNNPRGTTGETFGRNLYHAFDYIANALTLDVAELTVERLPQTPHDIGIRIDVAAGETVPRVEAANGSGSGPFDLQQAFLYFTLAGGLRFDLGKFISPVGYESLERYDSVSDNDSHSFLFLFGPFTHTGIKVSYATKIVTVAGYVTEGWDVLIDTNRDLSYGAQLVVTPNDQLGLSIIYFGGKEQPVADPPWRHSFDFVLTLKPTSALHLGANFDFGKEGQESWYGAAGYLGWGFLKDYTLAVRAEVFADPDGNRTGLMGGQTLTELTATLVYRFGAHHIFRAEARWDHSSVEVFPTSSGTSSGQVILAANYIGMF